MSKIDQAELKKLEKLARLSLEEKERESLLENLKKVLLAVERLEEIDTTNVAPCLQVIQGATAPLRDDEPERLITRQEFLKGAPDQIGGMIRVPKVIKEE